MIRDPGGRPPCRIPRARCERYIAEGLTVAEIASREGWSVSTVQRHLLALGLRMPSRAVVRIEDLLSIAAGRETVRDVCERLGVTRAAVHQRAHHHGLVFSGRGPRRPVGQLSFPFFREAA